MIGALDGWQLVAVIFAALLIGGLIILLLVLREGQSKKVRVGVFVEREYRDEAPDDKTEWPTQH